MRPISILYTTLSTFILVISLQPTVFADDPVINEGTTSKAANTLQTPASPTPQWLLDIFVERNTGYGGGVYRVSEGPDNVLWEVASGNAVRKTGEPMTIDATFEIASTSKTFTAAAVLLLVEQGLLDLDVPISTYLPDSYVTGLLVINDHDYGPELTLRQMLAHTSGLPDYWNDPPYIFPGFNQFLVDYYRQPNRFWEPEEIIPYIKDLDPLFIPDTDWSYSDSGYLLAGLIIEEVTGDTLADAYQNLIFTPLEMEETWIRWTEPAPPTVGLESHRYEEQSDMYIKQHNSADWAGGGLASTTRDLETFIRAIAHDELFADPATHDIMMTWNDTETDGVKYGLGLFKVALGLDMGHVWGHDGYGSAYMYHWDKYDITFTGTLNQTEANWWPLVFLAAWYLD